MHADLNTQRLDAYERALEKVLGEQYGSGMTDRNQAKVVVDLDRSTAGKSSGFTTLYPRDTLRQTGKVSTNFINMTARLENRHHKLSDSMRIIPRVHHNVLAGA